MATMIIRKPNLEVLTEEGIPKDFASVKAYFNFAIEYDLLPWIPRKTPITTEEIRNLWVPSVKTNICYIAELEGHVCGSATVFYDPSSTAYEHADLRKAGELTSTVSPLLNKKRCIMIDKEITKEIIRELKLTHKKAFARINQFITLSSGSYVLSKKLLSDTLFF